MQVAFRPARRYCTLRSHSALFHELNLDIRNSSEPANVFARPRRFIQANFTIEISLGTLNDKDGSSDYAREQNKFGVCLQIR